MSSLKSLFLNKPDISVTFETFQEFISPYFLIAACLFDKYSFTASRNVSLVNIIFLKSFLGADAVVDFIVVFADDLPFLKTPAAARLPTITPVSTTKKPNTFKYVTLDIIPNLGFLELELRLPRLVFFLPRCFFAILFIN